MEVFCRMCGVSSDESIVIMRAEFGDVLCQPCYEKTNGLDHLGKAEKLTDQPNPINIRVGD